MNDTVLNVNRIIKAPREKVFAAWINPDQLVKWWGPGKVTCPEAEVDLREGGQYRIANKQEDGTIVWIKGSFKTVISPEKLVYDWIIGATDGVVTLVTVLFNEHPDGTQIKLTHERFPTAQVRDMHLLGWDGCLDGLDALFTA